MSEFFQTYILDSNGQGKINYVGIFGEPVEQTKAEFPYSYDPYLIYGRPVKKEEKLTFRYSDRIEELRMGSFMKAKDVSFVESILTKIYEEDIKIIAIAEGANKGNGYPYLVYAFKLND